MRGMLRSTEHPAERVNRRKSKDNVYGRWILSMRDKLDPDYNSDKVIALGRSLADFGDVDPIITSI